MIPKEILKKVREIEIYTNRLVNESLAGEYHSVFKGRGMEFLEVREYQPGDDIRLIDWNVTARAGHPFVKLHVEERELTVIFVVDLSASGAFGTVNQMKAERAVELCAVLAFSAIKNHDKVGLIAFTDDIESYIPPKKGKNQVLRVTRRKHDVIPVTMSDPREREIPAMGLIEAEDPETGERMLLDTFDPAVRVAYAEFARQEQEQRERLFRSMKLDALDIRTDAPYIQTLMSFFHRRASRY